MCVSFKDDKLFDLIKKFVSKAGYRGQIDIDIFDIEQTHRGNYMYRIGKVEDDASDNIDNALTIQIETEIQKSFIGKDDIDFLKFTIPTTGTYDIEITTQDPIDLD